MAGIEKAAKVTAFSFYQGNFDYAQRTSKK